MAKPIDLDLVHLSLVEFVVCAGRQFLIKVGNNNALIVGKPRGILGEQFRPRPIHLLYVIILSITF
jgi:hypothetical protein